jgi:membrane protein implicated in regulation of membrane protease activity
MRLLWWHWIVAGIFLVVMELAIPAFFLVWFGVGAVLTGLCLLLFPSISFAYQLLTWTFSSVFFVWLWFRIFRKNRFKTMAGMARGQMVGEIGLVARDIVPFQRGAVRFQKPVLGAEVWEAIADEEIKTGQRVRVLEVEGNLLKVVRVN